MLIADRERRDRLDVEDRAARQAQFDLQNRQLGSLDADRDERRSLGAAAAAEKKVASDAAAAAQAAQQKQLNDRSGRLRRIRTTLVYRSTCGTISTPYR